MIVSRGRGKSGDGIGRSDCLGLRLKHLNSILSIHLFSFAVGEDAVKAIEVTAFLLWGLGESDRERLLVLMPAERSPVKTSRSDAGDMKYAKGSESMFSFR